MWIAELKSTGPSNVPALTFKVSGVPVLRCQSRDPQLRQNAQVSVLPDNVTRVQNSGSPCVTSNWFRGTVYEMPNAEEDCFWHSLQ